MSSKPFSYHLYHKPTGKHYYGIKYSKNCKPEDLWLTYFSSSKVVKQLIKDYGAQSFDVEIRKHFDSGNQALLWEHKVLRRLGAASRSDWINRFNGGKKFRAPTSQTQYQKDIASKTFKGVPKSESQKEKMRISAIRREQKRRDDHWTMPQESIEQALATKNRRIQEGIINPYNDARNKKMSNSKKGKTRLYLSCGRFVMV